FGAGGARSPAARLVVGAAMMLVAACADTRSDSAPDQGAAASLARARLEAAPPALGSSATRAEAAAMTRRATTRLQQPSPDLGQVAAELAQAAERGDPDAQYLLGVSDALRPADRRDPASALDWLARAAVQDHARAQFALGQAYADGIGTPVESGWANLWFERAARRGHHDAAFHLALRLIAGEGLPADPREAYKWLLVAERGGHREAARYRSALARGIDEPSRARAVADAAAIRAVRSESWPDPPLVRFVQASLRRDGADVGAIDGVVGARTRSAIAARAKGRSDITPELVLALRAPR
ncbi:MAG: hypothetical protein FJX57_17110, partial [Alphaproteobacteria bacterium]|nr:hypothetical protein [Alphaproteobacteria bacterium]